MIKIPQCFLVYKDKSRIVDTTLFKKQTDSQTVCTKSLDIYFRFKKHYFLSSSENEKNALNIYKKYTQDLLKLLIQNSYK